MKVMRGVGMGMGMGGRRVSGVETCMAMRLVRVFKKKLRARCA